MQTGFYHGNAELESHPKVPGATHSGDCIEAFPTMIFIFCLQLSYILRALMRLMYFYRFSLFLRFVCAP
jgi:hypothetical protein